MGKISQAQRRKGTRSPRSYSSLQSCSLMYHVSKYFHLNYTHLYAARF